MIRTVHDIKINASNPLLPLKPWNAFVGSAASIRITDVPRKIGNWVLDRIWVDVKYPNDVEISREAKRANGVYVATIDASTVYGQVGQGYQICASGKDENGDPVERYVLGVGDVNILKLEQTSSGPDTVAQWMRMYDERPDTPRKGDAVIEDGKLKVYDGTDWVESSGATMTSQLVNDAGFITDKQVKPGKTPGYASDAEWASKALSATDADNVPWEGVNGRPTNLSEFTNDMGFISSSNAPFLPLTGGTLTGNLTVNGAVHGKTLVSDGEIAFTEDDKGGMGITGSGGNIGFSRNDGPLNTKHSELTPDGSKVMTETLVDGKLANKADKTELPTKVSQLENDNGYLTTTEVKLGTTPGYVANADHSVSAQSAVDSETVPWSGVKFRPTTLEGYGITDAATKAELTALDEKVGTANTKLEGVA